MDKFESKGTNRQEEDRRNCPSDDNTTPKGSLHALPSSTVRLLGSSQVITSVSSAVKELIENSLDAGATSIEIKIEQYGLEKIEVRDNGSGISKEGLRHVAKHYHTSKISSFNDLQLLSTYGFRGEALGSLCSVSNLTITSKTEAEEVGTTISVNHQGEITSSKPSHFGRGTSIVAANLFKNLPVRKQFYSTAKKRKEELKRVEDLVMSFGVIRPDLRISLRHNRDLVWQKFAVMDHRTVLLNILGTATFNQLEKKVISHEDPKMEIEAFIPKAKCKVQLTSRSTGDRHLTFVNKRPVIMKEMNKVFRQHYTNHHSNDASASSRYPIYFLSVVLPSSEVDVNVEPNKTKVMMENQDVLLKLITEILETHYDSTLAPTTTTASKTKTADVPLPEKYDCQDSTKSGCSDKNVVSTEKGEFTTIKNIEFRRCDTEKDNTANKENEMQHADVVNFDEEGETATQSETFGSFEMKFLTQEESADDVCVQPGFGSKTQEKTKEFINKGENFIKENQNDSSLSVALQSKACNDTILGDINAEDILCTFDDRGDNCTKGNNSDGLCHNGKSQKAAAFEELMNDLNSDDILCTFNDTAGNSSSISNQSELLQEDCSAELSGNSETSGCSPTAAVKWSKGGLNNSDGIPIQGPALLLPASTSNHSTTTGFNGNGKRPSSPSHDAPEGPVPKKASLIRPAEITAFDLISSQPIKRPQTAFIHFSKEVRPQVVKEHPKASFPDIARIIGQKWKELGQSERLKYEQLMTKDVDRYKQQMSASTAASKDLANKGKKKLNKTPKGTVSIKDCLMNAMSPKASTPRRKVGASPPTRRSVKTVGVQFDLTRLKETYSKGLKQSQSQHNVGIQLIGCLKSHGSWICCHGNKIAAINTSRIEESVLYHRMMKSHGILTDKTEPPIQISRSIINGNGCHDLYSTLVAMAKERSELIGGHHHVLDKRLTDNGLDISWFKNPETDELSFQINSLPREIPFYGVIDLREILEQITVAGAEDVASCRPLKVINYLKSEAVRVCRKSPAKTQREDMEELLEQLSDEIPSNCVTCLHDKPFYHELFSLSDITFSQTQSSQTTCLS